MDTHGLDDNVQYVHTCLYTVYTASYKTVKVYSILGASGCFGVTGLSVFKSSSE